MSSRPPSARCQQLPAAQLDLRGMRVDEALDRLMPFLDRAMMDGHARVRVVHGIGTGRAAGRRARVAAGVRDGQPVVAERGPHVGGATDVDLA